MCPSARSRGLSLSAYTTQSHTSYELRQHRRRHTLAAPPDSFTGPVSCSQRAVL